MDLEQLNTHTAATSARSMEIFLAKPAELEAEAAAQAALETTTDECWELQNDLNNQLGQIVLAGVRHRAAVGQLWDTIWWSNNGKERLATHLGLDELFVFANPDDTWRRFESRHPKAVIGQVSMGGSERDLMVDIWATACDREKGSRRFLDSGGLPAIASQKDEADPLGLRWNPEWMHPATKENHRNWGLDEVGIEFFVNATRDEVANGLFLSAPACVATETFTVHTIDEVRGTLRRLADDDREAEIQELRSNVSAATKTAALLQSAVTPLWHIE